MNPVVIPNLDTADTLTLPGWRLTPQKNLGLEGCSLIVATYQRPEEIRHLLAHLLSLWDTPEQVLIVDASPSDATEKVVLAIREQSPIPFEVIYAKSPKGLTRQRNVGVDLSTREYLFFLDDDALPVEGYFAEFRRVLNDDLDHTIAAAGACIMNEIDRPISRRWQLRRATGLIPKTEPYIYNHAGTSAPTGLLKPFHGIRDVDIFPGGASVIRREVFSHMRFSEFFYGYSWGEDLEMSLRIRRRWRIVCCGDARVMHYGIPSAGGRPDLYSKAWMEVRNRYFIWNRYSQNTGLLNQLRFRLDLLFIFLMDLAWFAVRPWQRQHLSHAFGVLSGAVSCLFSPPKWNEPAPMRRYRLEGAAE